MIDEIFNAGVVGAGGAGFPTHVKLKCTAEVFIVNGIECEPLLRTDRHLMETNAREIVSAVLAIKEHLQARRTVIAVKKHYTEAVAALRSAIGDTGVELYLSNSFYPAGDEQNLVYSITGRVVPTGGIPIDVGAVVSNVATVYQAGLALKGIPITDRLITVSGSVAHPVTISAPVGTPMEKLLAAAGGAVGNCVYIIGGPLMGRVTESLEKEVVTKTTGGLLAIPVGHSLLERKKDDLKRDAYLAKAVCCQCAMCTQMCPRNALGLNVQPHKVMRALAGGRDYTGINDNGIFSCCDCGICTFYACNFGLHPSKAMQAMKADMQKNGVKPVKEAKYEPQGFENKRLPTERLLQRLDIKRFDVDAPMGSTIETDIVRIPLKMHVGGPCKPVINEGAFVSKGDLIAEPEGLGARIHASITGKVSRVDGQFIEIRK